MLQQRWRELGLTLRVLILLSLALMPLGAISFWQTQRLAAEAPRQARAALLSLTELAANPLQAAVQRGFGSAQAMVPSVRELRADPAACSAFLRRFVERGAAYSHAAFLDPQGVMTCSSDGRTADFGDDPDFRLTVEQGTRNVVRLADGPLSGTSVLIVTEPVRAPDGTIEGFVTLSLPDGMLDMVAMANGADRPFTLVTFNVRGNLLTSSEDPEAAMASLPAGEPLDQIVEAGGRSFIAVDGNGEERVYALVPIVPDLAYALSSWPRQMLAGNRIDEFVLTALMPLLMWLASLLVAFLALERLVFRHVRSLGRQMRAFARTRRTIRAPMLDRAGAELSQIEADFREMAQSIMQDEAQLEDNLREKNILLKEVHHRVKNNLQLISSIMNMQARQLSSPEARDVLRRVQDRVMGLAAVHRTLYQTEDIGRIDASAMVADLSRQIAASVSGEVTVDFQARVKPVYLDPDRAVALSLTVSELMTNAVAHAGALAGSAASAWIRLDLAQLDDNHARLVVSNAAAPEAEPAEADGELMISRKAAGGARGLGMQLIRAFSRQLNGETEIDHLDDRYTLTMTFPIDAYREAARDY